MAEFNFANIKVKICKFYRIYMLIKTHTMIKKINNEKSLAHLRVKTIIVGPHAPHVHKGMIFYNYVKISDIYLSQPYF